jgi:hypothetical protein
MVHTLRCLTTWLCFKRRVVGKIAVVLFWCLGLTGQLPAQAPSVHYLHHGAMPPGAIGSRQLQRGGPLPGFFQPVEINAPQGALLSLAADNQFDSPQATSRRAGLLIGAVYRLRVTNIPLPEGAEGLEVFPTVEIIDRTYAPADQALRFAIPVELTAEDLRLALQGKFVTRVIYVEDPKSATPVSTTPQSQGWFDVGPERDPLAVADVLGRPVAILRLGGRVPVQGPDPDFFFGSPAWVGYPQRPAPKTPAVQPGRPAPAKVAAPAVPRAVAPETPQP